MPRRAGPHPQAGSSLRVAHERGALVEQGQDLVLGLGRHAEHDAVDAGVAGALERSPFMPTPNSVTGTSAGSRPAAESISRNGGSIASVSPPRPPIGIQPSP